MKGKEKRTLHGVLVMMLMLGLMLIPGLLPEIACAADGTMTGDGSPDNPYQIEDYADLKAFADKVNNRGETDACAELTQDIQCTDKEWVPIGSVTSSYLGHFDGKGKIIKGLSNEDRPDVNKADYQGLFGSILEISDTAKGEVKNVGLEGGKITGKDCIGGVAGDLCGGTISKCYNTGAVSGNNYVGGVAGDLTEGTITNCYNSGAVNGNFEVGGVAGIITGGEITNCCNSGAVSGNNDVGGVAGFIYEGVITNCYYDMTFNADISAIGASDRSTVTNVQGLTTSQMTGASALTNMKFSNADTNWLVRANGVDAVSREYYEYYPHLKGFAYDSDPVAANWPAKPHVHKVGDETVYFMPWEKTDQLPDKAGSYYLTGDVTLSGAWVAPEGTTSLCLNGYGITGSDEGVIRTEGRILNLYDCNSTNQMHYFTVDSAGLATVNDAVQEGAKSFTGGYITGGTAAMNFGFRGGAVYVNGGTFSMYGGTIIGNKADQDGGGVFIGENGEFNLNDGSITYNTAGEDGGGVWVSSNAASCSISGASKITGNKTDGAERNVYLAYDKTNNKNSKIIVDPALTDDASIGVTLGTTDGTGVFTASLSGKLPTGKTPADIFFSDNSDLGVSPDLTAEGEAELMKKTATPIFSPAEGEYNKAQDVTISCSTEGAAIYYTTDGSDPTTASAVYSAPIRVPSTTTIKAIAEKAGMVDSEIAVAAYKISYQVIFDPGDGGSGDMDPQVVFDGDTFTFPECGFTALENKTFNYWEMSGVDGIYYPRDEVKIFSICSTPGGVITVTAHWKDKAIITNDPEANDLTYTGEKQLLVSAGAAQGGAMCYAIGNDDKTAPSSGWSANIPQETNASPYYVWYKAVGDSTHCDSDAKCCTAEIKKASLVLTIKAGPITYGQSLADSDLSGGLAKAGDTEVPGTFAWADPSIKPAVSDSDKTEYEVVFTPSDTRNYMTASTQITLTVNRQTIDDAPVVLEAAPLVYTGQPVTPVIQTIGGNVLEEGRDYSVTYSQGETAIEAPIDAGAYTMTITGNGDFAGTTSAEFTIDKAAGTLTAAGNKVKAKSKTKKLKKAKKISADKAYTIEGAIGELTYSKVKANKKNGKFKVNAATGQIKAKKGLKKGKYKLTVLISDPGDSNHEAAETQVVVKIKVKK